MTAKRKRATVVARPEAARAKRIVVKVGSAVLSENGALRTRVFGNIARQVSALRDEGREVLVVSSGAIAVGARELGWGEPGRSIPDRQAAAAVGQIGLGELYKKRFARHDVTVAQVLVTRAGLDDRERFLNARHTLHKLLELGVVPIVNENDTVATEEIRFGDNDNLSATIVNLIAAELLVILTDVDGMYHEPPHAGRPKPELFDVVDGITPAVERAAQASASAFGRGGMTTKLEAARAAARSGAATVLCNGLARDSLLAVCRGDAVGTLFRAGDRMQSRKHWLAFTARVRGKLHIDAGAVRALVKRGKSLLPAGITHVSGRFSMGDPVACLGPDGAEVARGLVAYSSEEITRIAGESASKISTRLGYSNGDAVIHRNDLVLQERA